MAGNVPANSKISPTYLEAKNAQELENKMLANNLVNRKQYDYQIVVMGNKFYAWFYADHSSRVKNKARGKE